MTEITVWPLAGRTSALDALPQHAGQSSCLLEVAVAVGAGIPYTVRCAP